MSGALFYAVCIMKYESKCQNVYLEESRGASRISNVCNKWGGLYICMCIFYNCTSYKEELEAVTRTISHLFTCLSINIFLVLLF